MCLFDHTGLDCVFTDFSKAYDSIWHDGLMYKLSTVYEINGPFLKCINSFIRNRFTRVLLKKRHSEWRIQKIGLPQGSSLSPILYILYTNDFKIKYTNFIRMGCFADDTAFWTTPATRNRLRYQILQKELNRFYDWTLYWKLSLNPSKCTNINIHKPKAPKINHKYRLNKTELNTIQECKYLGLWMDKHLNFKTHIDKTHSKLQGSLYRLYNLLKTGIKLFPKTIMQIYKCKSRPIIEYASIFYFHKDKTERLQKLQNRFIRCAYPCKKSTNIELLHMITNMMPLNIRINQLILRHWCRAKYSSPSHPLSKTLNNYNRYYTKIVKTNKNKNKYIQQSPFYRAEWIIDTKYPTTITSNLKLNRGPITALPRYNLHDIPSNYTVILEPINNIHIKDSDINFYVDGSCNPNPGMGAYGWYAPSYKKQYKISKIRTFKNPVSITTCEIMAIYEVLKYINKNPLRNNKNKGKNTINIYSDSKIALQYIKLQSYPKYQNTKIQIEKCLQKLHIIQNEYKYIKIKLIKVKSHSNIQGNNIIDKLVRSETIEPHYQIKERKNIPYSVTLTEIHQHSINEFKYQVEKKLNPDRLYYQFNNGKFTNKIFNIMKNGNFNKDQVGIITRIISQHIELNQYLYNKNLKDPNTNEKILSPMCNQCSNKDEESVSHFLMKCPKYTRQRTRMIKRIKRVCKHMNKPKYKTLKYILFPYLIPKCNTTTQIQIWKEVLSYIRNTKRFTNIRFINLDNI